MFIHLKTIPGEQQLKLQFNRLRDLMQAINKIMFALNGVYDQREIFKTVISELKKIPGQRANICLLNEQGKLVIAESFLPNSHLHELSKSTELEKGAFDMLRSASYREVIEHGRTLLIDAKSISKELFGNIILSELVNLSIRLDPNEKSILIPIIKNGKAIGVLDTTAPELSDDFVPSAELLSKFITNNLERGEELNTCQLHEIELQAITAHTTDIIGRLDIWGNFTYHSPSVISLGYTPEETIGTNAFDFIHPEDVPRLKKELVETLAQSIFTKKDSRVEYRYRKKDGTYVWLEANAVLEFNHGLPSGLITVARDITQRKQAEEEIRNLLAQQAMLITEIHHRDKNNMNTLYSLISLEIAEENNPEVITALHDIQGRIQAMSTLYEELHQSQDFSTVSAQDYVRALTEKVIGIFSRKDSIKLSFAMNEDIPITVKTSQALGIIINELLTNIMKYAFIDTAEPQINVSLQSVSEDTVELIIEDNGKGLPEDFSFERSVSTGLMAIGSLAEELQGAITTQPSSFGKGTAFKLTFKL